MKTNKITFLTILGLLFINFFVQSCSNDNGTIISSNLEGENQLTLKSEYFDFAGKLHNETLDYIFDETISKNNINNLNYELIKNSVIEYTNNVQNVIPIEDNWISNHKIDIKNAIVDNKFNYDILKTKFNSKIISELKKIESIIDKNRNTTKELVSLEENILLNENLSNDDKAFIVVNNKYC